MGNIKTDGRNRIREEIREWKEWLFWENLSKEAYEEKLYRMQEQMEEDSDRLEAVRLELSEKQDRLDEERKQFEAECKNIRNSMEIERKRLEQKNSFFDQKMKILQSGFEQLEEDRRKFDKEKDKFDAKKAIYDEGQSGFGQGGFSQNLRRSEMTAMLFSGVNSFLALKKRYKDLIKMFHPDNVAGDQEMVQLINREYEELKKAYEVGRQA